MEVFTLDTSGAILTGNLCPHPTRGVAFEWSDLSPFTQGYVEALFTEAQRSIFARLLTPGEATFSDLSPAFLARLLKDCEAALATGWYENTAESGRDFYQDRSAQFTTLPCCDPPHMTADFPLLRVFLNDQGQVDAEPSNG